LGNYNKGKGWRVCLACSRGRADARRNGRAGDQEYIQAQADWHFTRISYADRIDGAMAMVPS